MKSQCLREQTVLRHLSTGFGNFRWVRASYITQTFPRHFHEDFPLGVVEQGALGFYYHGANVVAPAGSINLANPGDVHTGQAAAEMGWTYRMFYFDCACLHAIAAELGGNSRDLPFFAHGVLDDPALAQQICDLHLTVESASSEQLEIESRLLAVLANLIMRHAAMRPALRRIAENHQAVKRAREYLETHYAENVSLEQLAQIAYLSPFHLVRLFHQEVGLPPHVYLTQVRVNHAKTLLAHGYPITDVAFDVGFVDQAHLHKRFKRIVGITPGQYRKNVQDK